ncbi:hypothetical protein JMJ35_010193 [Cladonia borealis]|uniref:S-adenosyl-L-methionine-dependent methyltransferase n=1 Tax=Cladonia borealis TaxID=184061 RepID=A0AA39QSA7_9LECA|nr:hypothetical protein JMJ35_010193 [Cladonia borealis]
MVEVLSPNLPDNTQGTNNASATYSEGRPSSPVIAQPGLESEDSTFGELASDTTSLKSDVTAYEYENGRRYHAYRSGRYLLPNDEQEQARLDLQHHVLHLAFKRTLYFAPISEKTPAILDLGTGTGIWAIEVGPSPLRHQALLLMWLNIIGTDLSPIQPRWVPPNIKFEVDDLELPWTFPHHFDLIHTRIMNGSIRDWPQLFRQSFNHCKPGGWMECQELVAGLILQVSGEFLRRQMTEAGFENITLREFILLVGDWPADPELQNIGRYQLVTMLDGIHAFTIALWTRFLGYKEEEVQVFLAYLREEFMLGHIHCYWLLYVVYGQKT